MNSVALERASDTRRFVSGQVVQDHQVARPRLGCQHLLDIGGEHRSIHRPVEDHRGDESSCRQTTYERGDLPMTIGRGPNQPLALGAVAELAIHRGREPGLVQEDQAFGLLVRNRRRPMLPRLPHIRAVLFGGPN